MNLWPNFLGEEINYSPGIKTSLACLHCSVDENVSGWKSAGKTSLQACHSAALISTTQQQLQKPQIDNVDIN